MRRRDMLGLLAGGIAQPSAAPRPNVVFILLDDLRWDALGYLRHPIAKTPHLDRISREGLTFENAFATTPLCSPARAGFLTGLHTRSHGILNNTLPGNAERSHQLRTWPRLLHDAGYRTGYVGKWHMGNDSSPRPGFDRWVSFSGQGRYEDPTLNIDGKEVETKGYLTDLLTGHAVDFLSARSDRPFCLYLAHKAVHGPIVPALRHRDLYRDASLPEPPTLRDTLQGRPAMADARKQDGPPDWAARQEQIRNQLRCLASVDEGVGRILDVLERSGTLDRTLVVFASDNGLFWGEHGLSDKRASYEESIRIPLAMRWPAMIRAGSRTSRIAINLDIAPTMLELCGAAAPRPLPGRSLVPLFRGAADGWRTHFFLEYYDEPRNRRIPPWECVRGERWKYTAYPGREGQDELYDLAADPRETRNLAGAPSARQPLEAMRRQLTAYRKEIR